MRALVVILALLLLLPFGAACGKEGEGTATAPPESVPASPLPSEPEPQPESEADDAVSWRDAADHADELVTVKGPVVSTFYADTSNGEPTFLNVGKDYPDPRRFKVIIWGEDRGDFPEPPEDMYWGCTVRVTGYVEMYDGVPQIEVTSPGDIEIVN